MRISKAELSALAACTGRPQYRYCLDHVRLSSDGKTNRAIATNGKAQVDYTWRAQEGAEDTGEDGMLVSRDVLAGATKAMRGKQERAEISWGEVQTPRAVFRQGQRPKELFPPLDMIERQFPKDAPAVEVEIDARLLADTLAAVVRLHGGGPAPVKLQVHGRGREVLVIAGQTTEGRVRAAVGLCHDKED